MTIKTSLFNKGIYKSTFKRYLWGSALYFVILFMFTGMSILLTMGTNSNGWNTDYKFLLSNEYIIIPLLLTIVVPTVAGLLIFRFIHSKRASVFVHSLPVKREANFVSSILAGLALMAIPVAVNTVILIIMSLSGYGYLFSVADCLLWMLCNFFGIFIMFSCVCFVASVTGNSFAMIVLNILLHTLLLILSVCMSVVAGVFLHGFSNDNSVINIFAENIFPVKIMTLSDYRGINAHLSASDIVVPVIASVVLYVLSVILYKKRRMETAEDVAGFKCLNPGFKYLATAMGALMAFSVCYSFVKENPFVFWLIVFIVSAVAYFVCEIFLKKTFRVWGSYKGYCAFAAVFAAIICTFAFTSFFGYENRIPDEKYVEGVAVYDYYGEEIPYLANEDVFEKTIALHKELIKNKPLTEDESADTYIHINYKLTNGSVLHRRYGVSSEEMRKFMAKLYENRQYKEVSERFFKNYESIITCYIYGEEGKDILENEKRIELIECIKKDISSLSYDEIYNERWAFRIEFEFKAGGVGKDTRVHYLGQSVNANFKNTISWIKENGYWEYVCLKDDAPLYIVKEWEELPFVNDGEIMTEQDPEKEKKVIKITGENVKKVLDYIQNAPQAYTDESHSFQVYQPRNLQGMDVKHISRLTMEEIEMLIK